MIYNKRKRERKIIKDIIKYSIQAIYYIILLTCFLLGSPLLKIIAVVLIVAELMFKFIQKFIECIWKLVNKRQ